VQAFRETPVALPAPQRPPDLDRHQRDLPAVEEVPRGVAPPDEGVVWITYAPAPADRR
jgi:hypothetical protein